MNVYIIWHIPGRILRFFFMSFHANCAEPDSDGPNEQFDYNCVRNYQNCETIKGQYLDPLLFTSI